MAELKAVVVVAPSMVENKRCQGYKAGNVEVGENERGGLCSRGKSAGRLDVVLEVEVEVEVEVDYAAKCAGCVCLVRRYFRSLLNILFPRYFHL